MYEILTDERPMLYSAAQVKNEPGILTITNNV